MRSAAREQRRCRRFRIFVTVRKAFQVSAEIGRGLIATIGIFLERTSDHLF
jgi:hypothetical protein